MKTILADIPSYILLSNHNIKKKKNNMEESKSIVFKILSKIIITISQLSMVRWHSG